MAPTPDDTLLTFLSLAALAGFVLGFGGGWHLRPKRKPAEITMLADGQVRIDTGYCERNRDKGASND